ncbi:MAG: universal stress protein [Sulfurimonas sp.]|uniref:universal stress protein n=1 Tax=Sulfurimonas sp. TaxID=2022749 RepID=UPI0026397108|nr:universal stress protein [Sulfurimonas sp.]MDD2652736.1 universal stress protein [Sulfurimonas sp.]MDD3450630.1 universal stress protein [Sulfurimonas sp.]
MQKFITLVATDFSKSSFVVLEKAIVFTQRMGGELHLVHVIESSFFSKKVDLGALRENAFLELNKNFSSLKKENFHCVSGKVKVEIANTAKILDADIIIMGNSGETHFLNEFLMGSHTKEIIKHAQTSLLVMKSDHELAYENIMVLTDMSEASASAIKKTAQLFESAKITLVNLYYLPATTVSEISRYGLNEEDVAAYENSIIDESRQELDSFVNSLMLPKEIDVTAHSIRSSLNPKMFQKEAIGIEHDLLVIHATQNVSFFAFDILEYSATDVLIIKQSR